jgi:hypothetical protein
MKMMFRFVLDLVCEKLGVGEVIFVVKTSVFRMAVQQKLIRS